MDNEWVQVILPHFILGLEIVIVVGIYWVWKVQKPIIDNYKSNVDYIDQLLEIGKKVNDPKMMKKYLERKDEEIYTKYKEDLEKIIGDKEPFYI